MTRRRSDRKPRLRPEETPSEKELRRIESDPELHRMIKQSEEDERAGRVYTRKQVEKLLYDFADKIRTGVIGFSTDEELDEMEADPRFQEMMRLAEEDERAGRWISHEDLLHREIAKHRRNPKRRIIYERFLADYLRGLRGCRAKAQ